ncbi:MAG: hypothetical protein IJF32_09175 [Oscillospiraceae bacterium]|nr:hypothetical protein [Oscillospiraceae bacterium]
MKKRWMIVADKYSGIIKNATDMLYSEISSRVGYVLPAKTADKLTETDNAEYNLIFVGLEDSNNIFKELISRGMPKVPDASESYSIYVGKGLYDDSQTVAIAGRDEKGILYGCMDFCNKYLGNVIHRGGDIWNETFFDNLFDNELPPFRFSCSPAVKNRAIWTWGHVIYDYRNFFENMARLRLNEVVIWNDHLPLNASDVVSCAHSFGIKVIWGFAWGWGTDCTDILEKLSENSLKKIKEDVVSSFKNEYSKTDCDGIYFQSFTELHTDTVGGKCVAETVVNLVNETAAELFKLSPDLHIQFGLHATSVKNNLDYISKVDERIHIIWEDCGSFPYNYYADEVSDFENTFKLTEKLITLRGKSEKFGAVFKGMPKLDWTRFEHFTTSYILGERTNAFIRNRLTEKQKIWKKLQSDWLRNGDCIRKVVELIAKNNEDAILQALVEDSMFEKKIMFPAALYAELLWNPFRPINETIAEVANYPCVEFAN